MSYKNVTKVLTGHTSPETSYLVGDYPYGRKVRCRIRYWIETSKTKGFRFCSQTEHPRTGVWNNPKKGTYFKVAACMYIDDIGHVQCARLSEYSSAEECKLFAEAFPQAACIGDLRVWCVMKLAYARKGARGEIVWAINGVAQPVSDDDKAKYAEEWEMWSAAARALKPPTPGTLSDDVTPDPEQAHIVATSGVESDICTNDVECVDPGTIEAPGGDNVSVSSVEPGETSAH